MLDSLDGELGFLVKEELCRGWYAQAVNAKARQLRIAAANARLEHAHIEGVGQHVASIDAFSFIDWERRHKLMRMHTALHLICAAVDAEISGCQIGEEKSRIDLNTDGKPDKEEIQAALDRLVAEDRPTGAKWITDDELAANPDLVKTMSVQPPTGQGKVRLMEIDGIDLQPCGGTHVARTGEIGKLRVGKIENKGRSNKRINIHLED